MCKKGLALNPADQKSSILTPYYTAKSRRNKFCLVSLWLWTNKDSHTFVRSTLGVERIVGTAQKVVSRKNSEGWGRG